MVNNEQSYTSERLRIGIPPFLNVQPLIYGLADRPDIQLLPQSPAMLAERLHSGLLDAALVPSIDYLCHADHWQMLPAGVIATQGEVLTVRVFSQTPLDQIEALSADLDSHTSVVLVQVLWRLMFHRPLPIHPLHSDPSSCSAALLIGDKVIPHLGRWNYELDLGAAWKQTTGLPFVFALWAAPIASEITRLTELLCHARQEGLAHIAQIAHHLGPRHGYEPRLAEKYLTHHLHFAFGDQENQGLQRFFQWVQQFKLLPAS